MKQMIKNFIGLILIVTILLAAFLRSDFVYAANNSSAASGSDNDTVVVVSMGDSYSSGEGIEKFYGQDSALIDKVQDEDWLAHRSTLSWPALLEIPGIDGTLADYNVKTSDSTVCQWYFVAASGATTENFYPNSEQYPDRQQKKTVNKVISSSDYSAFKALVDLKTALDIDASLSLDVLETRYRYKKATYRYKAVETLPAQLSVFDEIEYGTVNYVTLTIGGNDLDFSGIITSAATGNEQDLVGSIITAAVGSTVGNYYLNYSGLKDKLDDSWDKFYSETRDAMKKLYKDIAEKAGPQAAIIVAGYPRLLNADGGGIIFSEKEAELINSAVVTFNEKIEEIVDECQEEGLNIYYVSVLEAFEGHEAYTENAWINPVYLLTKSEDINSTAITSSYSIHPNETGAKEGYAACVNAKIEEIEEAKSTGTLEGTVSVPEEMFTWWQYFTTQFWSYTTQDVSLSQISEWYEMDVTDITIRFEDLTGDGILEMILLLSGTDYYWEGSAGACAIAVLQLQDNEYGYSVIYNQYLEHYANIHTDTLIELATDTNGQIGILLVYNSMWQGYGSSGYSFFTFAEDGSQNEAATGSWEEESFDEEHAEYLAEQYSDTEVLLRTYQEEIFLGGESPEQVFSYLDESSGNADAKTEDS